MTSLPASTDALLHPPTDIDGQLRYRARLLAACDESPELRRDCLSLCAQDIHWTFNTFFWTKNPRVSPSDQPFALYPHEADLLHRLDVALTDKTDLLIEKSRDMGVTWTILCWLLWHWRFDASFHALLGSRLEDLIDEKGNLDTHFERLRWELRHLPEWWLPHQFDASAHLVQAFSERQHVPFMRLLRPDSDNTIVGEAVTEDFSRQGRYNVVFLDEMAACESAEGAWVASADSAPMRVASSTPKGLGNTFARLRHSGSVPVVSFHWSLHPEKRRDLRCQTHGERTETCQWPACRLTSTWYEAERTRREADPTSIAQELDIDYLGAGNPYLDLAALALQPMTPPAAVGFLVEVDWRVEFRPDPAGLWAIWEFPDDNGIAVVGGDPSEGIGQDESAAVVRDARHRGMKARLVGQLDTDQFAHELAKAGKFYRNALVACEVNGPGFAVNADLSQHYGKLYYELQEQRLGHPPTKRFGWRTTARTKELMCEQLREEVREGAALMRDQRLMEQCKTFIRDEQGRLRAEEGYKDDLVIAWAIAGMAVRLVAPKARFDATLLSPRQEAVRRRRAEAESVTTAAVF